MKLNTVGIFKIKPRHTLDAVEELVAWLFISTFVAGMIAFLEVAIGSLAHGPEWLGTSEPHSCEVVSDAGEEEHETGG
ncbi:MAG TPA: hypothetical protein VG122_14870 [Gemmata sp.]|jgi:hypothetical protein|nr:hypothetical protein [Gemmata sp.]